jgi:putative Mg2+ transporter-C (MgtC) family protein
MDSVHIDPEHLKIMIHVASAWAAGSLIGLERSYHGRPAGFRTHSLVCVAAALLMIVTSEQMQWVGTVPSDTVRTDPTRMAQGIMTGIGFLGAGVIFKEGLTVRGLTTAASIWITSALGILYGVGLYFPAVLGTAITLGTLALFRWFENRMPSQIYAHHALRFARDRTPPETEVRKILADQGFSVANMSYRLDHNGSVFEYRMVIKTLDKANMERLADKLRSMDSIVEFRVSPTGD